MWMIDPKIMCRQHLLGEHNELHAAVGCLNSKGRGKIWINSLIKSGYIEIHKIKKRHKELVKEMKRRDYSHNSPLPEFDESHRGKINIEKSLSDLLERCEKCKRRMKHENQKHH